MASENLYKELAELSRDMSILYVEDNSGLQKQASKIFQKFFKNVYTAQDGVEGIDLFKKHDPEIIITDLRMPNLGGLEMSKQIKDLNPDTKILVTSAYNDKEKLLECIRFGATDYLKKPIKVDTLIETLYEIVKGIYTEKNRKLFDQYVGDSFEYQEDMLILVENTNALIANKKCLDFFNKKNIDEFKKLFLGFSKELLPHNNFLSEETDKNWLETLKQNSGKLFNILLKNQEGKERHFVIKSSKIPNKDELYIFSFNDITELGLLVEEDENISEEQRKIYDKKRAIPLLKVIKRNKSKLRLYNSYKGLSISNIANLIEADDETIRVKTTYFQQKAIHLNQNTIIESEILPKAIICDLKSLNFELGEVILQNFTFTPYLPSQQQFVRVQPEEMSSVSVLQNGKNINVDIKIANISVSGCSLSVKALPIKFKVDAQLSLKVMLGSTEKPLRLIFKGKIFKTKKREDDYEVVVLFEENQKIKKVLIDYIAKRQMALIREFKGLENA